MIAATILTFQPSWRKAGRHYDSTGEPVAVGGATDEGWHSYQGSISLLVCEILYGKEGVQERYDAGLNLIAAAAPALISDDLGDEIPWPAIPMIDGVGMRACHMDGGDLNGGWSCAGFSRPVPP
ncbi:unnamed protein product [Ostreobium quekettii]|uniref:Uncharacterized protein n=1 Tax=Ostreobium quekettii TaxID=121088 RepID=A0A8S1J3B1_9CHLO|nr:unnamed protein product [Ostreobium quekettii]